MAVLLVASDRPGAGKTAASLALASLSNRAGLSALVFKPFADGGADADPGLIAALANPAPVGWPIETTEAGLPTAELSAASAVLSGASADAELTIVELPGSAGPASVSAAASALNASVLLVSSFRRDLRGSDLADWADALGGNLRGVLVNGLTRYLGTEAGEIIRPSFEEAGIPLVGIIPEDRLLLSLTVDQVRENLDGRYVVEEGDTESAIEWFQVGCMSLDPGEPRFRMYENNAVVVRGDRPDIQMSALNASVSCLVLTGGIEPIEYISYEAGEEEVPVILVEPDTLSTMTLLNDVTSAARMDTAAKVARYGQLLEAHADIERIWSAE